MSEIRMEKVCIVGLGYIGVPTAAMFARSGLDVLGVDVNVDVIAALEAGRAVHADESGLPELVREAVRAGRLRFSTRPAAADAFVITVPTPINADTTADLRYVVAATESIVPYLQPDNLVILESTVPPGTVDDVMLPILRRAGLVPGKNLWVAHSPERVIPGRLLVELVENSRLMGGIDAPSAELAAILYRRFVKGEILRTDARTAEMVKLMENTFRDVNVALANEFARICDRIGIDVWEAIALANHHPRVNFLRPGPGVGGHCIAVDPWFIVEKCPDEARLISQARRINDSMPGFAVDRLEAALGKERARIAAFGLAFKGNVDDIRESPAIHVVEGLRRRGHTVVAYDPHVAGGFSGLVADAVTCAQEADAIIVLTDHDAFRRLDPAPLAAAMQRPLVFDTRCCLDRARWEGAGFTVLALGDGRRAVRAEQPALRRALTATP